jgi:hypothetical protein
VAKIHQIGGVLNHLAQQDKCYKVSSEHSSKRVRVSDIYFTQLQDDPSLIFSLPADLNDMQYLMSFKLAYTKLLPSTSRYKMERISPEHISLMHQFTVFEDKVIYALSQKHNQAQTLAYCSD